MHDGDCSFVYALQWHGDVRVHMVWHAQVSVQATEV